MANTMTLIASSIVGAGGTTSIDFTSIPSTYTDLCIKLSARSDRVANIDDQFIIKPNGSTSSLTYIYVRGDGAAASSSSLNRTYVPGASSTSSTFGNAEIYVPNYAGTTNKSFFVDSVEENNATTAYMSMQAVLWSNTAAITSLNIAPVSGTTFVQYSTAYLYGVKNA
jgi:hypothetical protein